MVVGLLLLVAFSCVGGIPEKGVVTKEFLFQIGCVTKIKEDCVHKLCAHFDESMHMLTGDVLPQPNF